MNVEAWTWQQIKNMVITIDTAHQTQISHILFRMTAKCLINVGEFYSIAKGEKTLMTMLRNIYGLIVDFLNGERNVFL